MSIQGTLLYTKSKETIYPITNSNSVLHGDKSLNEVIDSVEEEVSSFKSEVKSEVDKINNFESLINSIQDQIKNLLNNIPSDTPSDTPDENIPVNFTNLYTLIPSSHVINKGDTITVKIRKTTQEGSTLLNYGNAWSSEDLKVLYSINGTNWFDYRPKIIVDSNITLRLKQNTTIIDEETILVLDVPEAFFLSFVFCRYSEKPDKPIGGSYTDPKPDSETVTVGGKNTNCKWEDSVPNGTDTVWMSSCRFSSVNPNTAEWSNPADMSDSVKMEILYSPGVEDDNGNLTYPEIPEGFNRIGLEIDEEWLSSAEGWYDEPIGLPNNETPVWMAINTYENNAWLGWQISRIKGEDGKNGTSINIKGSVASKEELEDKKDVSISDSYITLNDGHLHVWDGDSWTDCGPFKGEPGKANYLHIKYANLADSKDVLFEANGLKLKLTKNDGEEAGDFIGTLVDENPEDSTDNLTDYTWKDLSPLTIRFDPPRLYLNYNIIDGTKTILGDTTMWYIDTYLYSGSNSINLHENLNYSIDFDYDNTNSLEESDSLWSTNSDGFIRHCVINNYGTNYIKCTITENATGRTATEIFNIIYVKNGDDGKQGAAGPMLYPQGEWNSTTTYTLTKKDGNVIAKPFVVYKNEDGEDEYYVLKQNSTNNEPSENSEYWEKFTKIKYLFTEVLMANWAKLASFIFYDNLMFSQKGHVSDGTVRDVSKNDIKNSRFSGFIPNTYIDSEEGAFGCCKFSEDYKHITDTVYRMDLSDSHNISIDTYNDKEGDYYKTWNSKILGYLVYGKNSYDQQLTKHTLEIIGQPRVLILPNDKVDENTIDGTHITIVNQRTDGMYAGTSSQMFGIGSPLLVLGDESIFDTGSKNSKIIWNGYRIFGIVVPAGGILKLRSIIRKEGNIYKREWYVENPSEFEQIGFELTVDETTYQFLTKLSTDIGTIYDPIVLGGNIVKDLNYDGKYKSFSILNRFCFDYEPIRAYSNGNEVDNTSAVLHMKVDILNETVSIENSSKFVE